MAVAIIRTSDRSSFKRCRRKWGFSSHLKANRTQSESASYFWLGTAGHYALEDYHGYNYYKHPVEAVKAFVYAQQRYAQKYPDSVQLPSDYEEQQTLVEGLLDYYLLWLKHRDNYQTLWVDGVPQVEVKGTIELPIETDQYDRVLYQFTLDRVVVIDGELWVLDYKFYNRDWTPDPDFDAQMSAYIWAASHIYDQPIAGAILEKHFKKLPDAPRVLQNGHISTNKSQATTYHLYREALVDKYGSVEQSPLRNRECLEELLSQESASRDNYIKRDPTRRTPEQILATGTQIMMEVQDMINPDLPMYKNETKDCSWDCSFSDICIAMDMNVDWHEMLMSTTVSRSPPDDTGEGWRDYLPHIEQHLEEEF